MGDQADHERLAAVLHSTPAAVVLSGYPSPLYDRLYGDWHTTDLATMAHSSNAATSGRGDTDRTDMDQLRTPRRETDVRNQPAMTRALTLHQPHASLVALVCKGTTRRVDPIPARGRQRMWEWTP